MWGLRRVAVEEAEQLALSKARSLLEADAAIYGAVPRARAEESATVLEGFRKALHGKRDSLRGIVLAGDDRTRLEQYRQAAIEQQANIDANRVCYMSFGLQPLNHPQDKYSRLARPSQITVKLRR